MELNNNRADGKPKLQTFPYFRRNGIAIYMLPVVAAMVCFANSIPGEFIHDDIFAIVKNPDVTGKRQFSALFSNDFWGKSMGDSTSHKSYRPLCVLTFKLNYMLSGLNPIPYHIVNVLLHAGATWLFTYVCLSIVRLSALATIVASVIFAVHPIHTEAVSGIVGRADILAAIFFLLSFVTFSWSCQPRKSSQWQPRFFCTSLCLAICAVLSKETGITVIGVNLIYDICVVSQIHIKRLLKGRIFHQDCFPFVERFIYSTLTLITCLLVRCWLMGWELPPFLEQDNPAAFSPSVLTRFLTYNFLSYFNVQLLLSPHTLSYDWQIGSIPLVHCLIDPRNCLTLFTYCILTMLAARAYFKIRSDGFSYNPVLLGLVFLCVPFVPASNLFFRVGFVVAERLLYIPSMGFCILVAHGYTEILKKFPRLRWLLTTMILVTIGTQVIKTLVRNSDWNSREALFRSGLKSVPSNAKVFYNYGNYLNDNDDKETSIEYIRKAIQLYPKYAVAWNNLGTLLSDQREAEQCYREALKHHPEHIPAFINLGSLLFQQGNTDDGLSLLRQAETLNPHDPNICIMLGSMLGHLGETTEAGKYFRKAIQEKPDFADAYNNYGAYLQQIGQYSEAVENYHQAVMLDSSHVDAMSNAAQSLRHLGRLTEAEDLLKQAVELKKSALTLDKLGKFYFTTGKPKKALAIYRQIEDKLMNSSDATGLINYAFVLIELKMLREAEVILAKVIQVNDEDAHVLHQLSNVKGLQQQHQQGLVYIDKAIAVATIQGDRPMLGQLHFSRASHLKDLKQYEDALMAYMDSLAINNNQPKAHVNVGAIYHMKHDLKMAKHHYTETLKLEPANHIARDNLQKLEKLANKKRVNKPG